MFAAIHPPLECFFSVCLFVCSFEMFDIFLWTPSHKRTTDDAIQLECLNFFSLSLSLTITQFRRFGFIEKLKILIIISVVVLLLCCSFANGEQRTSERNVASKWAHRATYILFRYKTDANHCQTAVLMVVFVFLCNLFYSMNSLCMSAISVK